MKVTLVQPGNRQWRSRRITSRRWARSGIAGPGPRTWCGRRRRRPRWRWWRHRRSVHGLRVDQAVTLELAGELGRLAGVVDEGGERDVDDDEVRAGRGGPARCARDRRADDLHEGVAERWSQGVSPSVGDLAGPGLERSGSRHRTRPAAGPSWCGMVVEAEKAPVVLGPGRGRAASAAIVRAMSASSRTEHSRAWSRSSRSVSGVATSATARTLSKEMSPAHSDPTRCGMSQAFSPSVCQRPGGRASRRRSAPRPRAPIEVAPSSRYAWRRSTSPSPSDDVPFGGRHAAERARRGQSRCSSFDMAATALIERSVAHGAHGRRRVVGHRQRERSPPSEGEPADSRSSRSGPPCSGREWGRPSRRSPRASSWRSAAPGGCSG